jgi:hypothetical protein
MFEKLLDDPVLGVSFGMFSIGPLQIDSVFFVSFIIFCFFSMFTRLLQESHKELVLKSSAEAPAAAPLMLCLLAKQPHLHNLCYRPMKCDFSPSFVNKSVAQSPVRTFRGGLAVFATEMLDKPAIGRYDVSCQMYRSPDCIYLLAT